MIRIESPALELMKAHALSIFPEECCGFLLGNEQADGIRQITVIREVDNAKPGDKKRRFEITGRDYMLAERFAQESGLLLLGIYHSHPGHPAVPSETDRLAAQPYFSYVIVSVVLDHINHIRSWRLNENAAFEEEIFSPVKTNPSISWQQ
jgi:proteasome lid subunit RPN8/RPN11